MKRTLYPIHRGIILLLLLIVCFFSCKEERQRKPVSFETSTIYTKSILMKPYMGYEVSRSGIQLTGEENRVLPTGNVSITLEGIGKKHFAIGFDREILLQKFDGFFGIEDMTSIEYYDEQDELVLLESGSKAFVAKYHELLHKLNLKETTLYVFLDLPALCYEKLPNPEVENGFRRHFSQKIGGQNPRVLYDPWIKLNRLVFLDLKSKGLLKSKDFVYVNFDSEKGYSKHQVKEVEVFSKRKER